VEKWSGLTKTEYSVLSVATATATTTDTFHFYLVGHWPISPTFMGNFGNYWSRILYR